MKVLSHPLHGYKPWGTDAEARADMLNGWSRAEFVAKGDQPLPASATIDADPVADLDGAQARRRGRPPKVA